MIDNAVSNNRFIKSHTFFGNSSVSQSNSKNYIKLQRFARRSLTFLTNSKFEYSRPFTNKLRKVLVTAFSAEFHAGQFDRKLSGKPLVTERLFAVFSAAATYLGGAVETCQFFVKHLKRTSAEIYEISFVPKSPGFACV